MDSSNEARTDIPDMIYDYCMKSFDHSQLQDLDIAPNKNKASNGDGYSIRSTKLALLNSLISEKVVELEKQRIAPHYDPSSEKGYENVLHILSMVQDRRNDFAGYEATCRRILAVGRRDPSEPNLAALANFAYALTEQKKFEEAEPVLRALVPLLQDRIGRASPQALGGLRTLAETLHGSGETGRIMEARKILDGARVVVEGIEDGELRKDEMEAIEELEAKFRARDGVDVVER